LIIFETNSTLCHCNQHLHTLCIPCRALMQGSQRLLKQ
jgi:hypothetical protein